MESSRSLRWKIRYSGQPPYSNLDGSAFDAPALGVQVISQADPVVGRVLVRLADFYWFDHTEDYWYGGDIFGLWDYLTQPGPKKVIFGRTVPTRLHDEIVLAAANDPELPIKTAQHETEDGRC